MISHLISADLQFLYLSRQPRGRYLKALKANAGVESALAPSHAGTLGTDPAPLRFHQTQRGGVPAIGGCYGVTSSYFSDARVL